MAKKDFFIPQVEEDVTVEVKEQPQETKKKYHPEGFVSSIYGKNVVDNTYYQGVKYENRGRQYDTFRERDKRVDVDDFKDYIIPRDIFSNNNNNNNNNQNAPVNKQDTIVSSKIEEPIYQETFMGAEEVEEEVYDEQPLQKEEFVSVNNNVNNYFNGNNNSYYEEEEEVQEEIKPVQKPIFNPQREKINVKVGESETLNIKPKKKIKYVAPPLEVLKISPKDETADNGEQINQRNIIDLTLKQFDIGGHVVAYTKGPTVTQFEVQLDDGVRNQKIIPIQSNLQGNLRAKSIRMQIPIPLKSTIGIEVPNVNREMVYFGDMIANKEFLNDGNPLNVVLGVNISGEPVYLDIPKMPHGLIAGSTGSGKSVCINAIIASILYKAHPDDVKLVLVDPKRVEFARYSGIPHLATPIITEPKMANAALKWIVDEMENRYRLFETTGVTKYTEYIEEASTDGRLKHIPYIVIIIDELADLMMTSGPEVEESIMRITQKARAAGIHLIVATQRPSVNIISGTIKTNIPTRIAFKVGKAVDSSIILDRPGAEKLLGLGDMLYIDEMGLENRIQGAFISTPEIKQVVASLENYNRGDYLFTEEDLKKKTMVDHSDDALADELFCDIARYVVENNTASINLLQKKFSCGFSRIQAIIIKLGELGVVSENLGSRAREVLVNSSELEEILENI